MRLENPLENAFRTTLENHFGKRFPFAACPRKETGVHVKIGGRSVIRSASVLTWINAF
jgi:hypothetical protein